MARFASSVLVLLIATHLAFSSNLSTEDVKKMEQYRVVPDVISAAPAAIVSVKYGDLNVDMGNELTPTQVHPKPVISWDADKDAFYTLVMNDPDIPPHIGAKEVQHWLVVNIPGNDILKGDTLFDYVGSGPPKGSGLHRYIFLVYKQPGKLDKSKYDDIKETSVASRRQYVLKDLLQRFGISDPPAAGNFYRAQYDDNVPKYHMERAQKFEKPQ